MNMIRMICLFPLQHGGSYNATQSIIGALRASGIDIRIIKTIRLKRIYEYEGPFTFLRSVIDNLLTCAARANSIHISQSKLEYCYSNNLFILFGFSLWQKFRNTKLIYHFHGFDFDTRDKTILSWVSSLPYNRIVKIFYLYPLFSLYGFVEKIALRRCTYIFAPSLFSKQKCLHRWNFLDGKKIVVIRNGVDHHIFYPKKIRAATTPGKKKILYVGRITPEKGIEELIQAYQQLRDKPIALTIAGFPQDKDYFKYIMSNISEQSGISIYTRASPRMLAHLYRTHDITVIPSLVTEQFPLVYLESISCGTPVISNQNMPALYAYQRSIDRDLLSYSPHPSSLAKKIWHIASYSKKKYIHISEACIAVSTLFSWQKTASDIRENIMNDEAR